MEDNDVSFSYNIYSESQSSEEGFSTPSEPREINSFKFNTQYRL